MSGGARVELVWEASCPHVEAAREVVREALAAVGVPERWNEWQIGVDTLPAHARGYGSPSVFVDGREVTGATAGDADDCCRVYRGPTGLGGVPTVSDVMRLLSRSARRAT